jgi:hypothetical protein
MDFKDPKIYCENGKNAKGFGAHASPMQNSKFGNGLSSLKNFNGKYKINLNVKLVA